MRIVRAVAPWGAVCLIAILMFPARWGGLFGWTVVAGESMEPTMSTGDLALTMKRPEYNVGDVIVYAVPDLAGRYIVHRVIDRRPDGSLVTQGDNRDTKDQWFPVASDVQGTVVVNMPRCDLAMCRGLGWPLLFFTLVMSLAAAVGVFEISRHGLWPSRVRLPRGPFLGGDPARDRARMPTDMHASDVNLSTMLAGVLREEFEIHYEPSVSLRTGEVRSVELHARWHHSKHGLITSNVFLPMQENTVLEGEFDTWVARTGLRQVAAWRGDMELKAFVRLPHAQGQQLMSAVDSLVEYADYLGLRRDDIVFGIPTGPFMLDHGVGWKGLKELSSRGVATCLHHVPGAGPTPIELAASSPVDYLTLDMSRSPLPREADDSPLSRAVVRAADKGVLVLGRQVVQPAEAHALADHGAVGFFGPLFAPPLSAERVVSLLAGTTAPRKAKTPDNWRSSIDA